MDERKNINRITGVLEATNTKAYVARGEQYYLAYLIRGEVTIPVIVSKYYSQTFDGKHVVCDGVICVASPEVKRDCKILSYFYCLLMNESSEEKDTGYVKIEGTIDKLWDIELTPSNSVVRKLKLECSVDLDRPAKRSAPCRCFSVVARKSLELQVGDNIVVTGYVSGNRTALRVVVKNYEKIK